jgi:phage-related protein
VSEVAWINDTPLTDLGLYVTAHPRWLSSPEFDYPVAAMPGSVGGIPSDVATVGAGSYAITARVEPTSLTNREDVVNAIHYKLKGLLELRFADQPDKVLDVQLSPNVEIAPEAPTSFVEPGLLVTLNFIAASPYKRDRWGQMAGFGSVRTEIPLGDLPSAGIVEIMGSASNPVLTYRAASGEALETMTFTITLAATDFLEIDLGKRTIYKNVSGVRTRVDSIRTAGYFFNLDPADGSPDFEDWPTLEVSAGDGLILYNRNWSS